MNKITRTVINEDRLNNKNKSNRYKDNKKIKSLIMPS